MSRWEKAIFTGIALVSLLTLTACGKAASSNSSHTSSKVSQSSSAVVARIIKFGNILLDHRRPRRLV